ncbi:MAG: hypothetical protein MJ252_18485 [archaeon]|nr:hypothetical protein [archaeon]
MSSSELSKIADNPETPTDSSVVNVKESIPAPIEKSTFERAIIEAFKQTTGNEIIQKLLIAFDEIQFLVEDVKASNGTKYIFNKNIMDKLSRLTERKYFNVNILIAKIYESLLEASNFDILSNDLNLLISFCNEVLNMLEVVKGTNIARSLEKKSSCLLNYMMDNTIFKLEGEQKETIQELIDTFPTRNSSSAYQNFSTIKDQIVDLCKKNSLESKLEGIILLMENFGCTYSLEEQFDLLFEYCPNIIKSAIYQPNPDFHRLYFQLGNFIISMLFSLKFKVNAKPVSKAKMEIINTRVRTYFLKESFDIKKEDIKINNYENLSFLDEVTFELTEQKDVLLKCENIFSICQLIINTLSIYEKNFDLQYICYLILKKIYFIFPQFREKIEDLLALILTNICLFSNPNEKVAALECRQFLTYLLKYSENESLKTKLQHKIESKPGIDISLPENQPYDQETIETDIINFNEFNLRVGYPCYMQVDAGIIFEKFIEISEPNSLIYIGFATQAYDINFKILKYIQEEKSEKKDPIFKEIYSLDKVNCSEIPVKVVLLAKEPGIFKVIFDNSYSWMTSKIIRYRMSVLKPISPIDMSKVVDTTPTEVTLEKKEEKTEQQKLEEKEIEELKVEIQKSD